jgi:hypothetical protein
MVLIGRLFVIRSEYLAAAAAATMVLIVTAQANHLLSLTRPSTAPDGGSFDAREVASAAARVDAVCSGRCHPLPF